jgi:methenyltetrahydromethanopterin cyclohydrolase
VKLANVYILVAPSSSLVCAVQVSARIIEQTLHRLPEEGFDVKAVRYAQGYCVVPPLTADELVAMGRINDALLYGGEATLYVEASDEAVADVVAKITSSVSRVYGRPFLEIYEDAGRDFYQIPLDLHSPAAVTINNLTTGHTFSAGAINYEVLRRSFFGN